MLRRVEIISHMLICIVEKLELVFCLVVGKSGSFWNVNVGMICSTELSKSYFCLSFYFLSYTKDVFYFYYFHLIQYLKLHSTTK